jgi:hypothetical protein
LLAAKFSGGGTTGHQQSEGDSRERTQDDEQPERQVAGAGGPMQGQQRAPIDGGQGERGKGAGQQRLPADQPSAPPALAASLASPRPRLPGLTIDRIR